MLTNLLNSLAFQKNLILAKEIHKKSAEQFFSSECGMEKVLLDKLDLCLLKSDFQRILINIFCKFWALFSMHVLAAPHHIEDEMFEFLF